MMEVFKASKKKIAALTEEPREAQENLENIKQTGKGDAVCIRIELSERDEDDKVRE